MPKKLHHEEHPLYDGCNVKIEVGEQASSLDVCVSVPTPGMVLHWAFDEWKLPSPAIWPKGTVQAGEQAVQTPFIPASGGKGYQVRLAMGTEEAPHHIVFVLKDGQDNWYNNGSCYGVMLKAPSLEEIVRKVIDAESTYSNWSLFNRFCMAADILDSAEAAGPDGMAFVYTWLRFSANKQLAWYRNNNYQSKDIAHVQKRLAEGMAWKVKGAKDVAVRRFARMALATLPRGGGDSEQIRMGILHIMREHGIREGHRPGIEEKFLEQWHQKLHTNTSPEDIPICEAYLHFLHTNSHEAFFHALWEKGGITRDWMHSMDHPITALPLHLPHLIPAFQHFLWILKTVHSGADLDTMVEMSKGFLDDSLKASLYDILGNRDAWWAPGKIVEARKALEHVWKSDWASRDVLLLDIALENYFSLSIGRMDKSALSKDDLCELISLVLHNGCIGAESVEMGRCQQYWDKVKSQKERWSADWARLAMAAMDTISLALQAYMDEIVKRVQPHAEEFGVSCNIPQSYVINFSEEAVRGQPLFVLSVLLQCLAPSVRKCAGLGSWQVVSQVAARGRLLVIPSLGDIQGQTFASPTIVLAGEVGGMEDIPVGVSAILSATATDVLSHVAIRARNGKVLLASCFELEKFDALKALEGKEVEASADASGDVVVVETSTTASDSASPVSRRLAASGDMKLASETTNEWVLAEEDFTDGLVGRKSGNLAKLRSLLRSEFEMPAFITLPFGTFERVLEDGLNGEVASQVQAAVSSLSSHDTHAQAIPAELAVLRKLVGSGLRAPHELRGAVTALAERKGLVPAGSWQEDGKWAAAWEAMCQVWASKWTDRAWLSRRARGIAEDSLKMACLLQPVVPAQYAFVVHTAHPVTGDRGSMLAEAVVGLGETLVGNYPGRAFSFSMDKDCSSSAHAVVTLPSKRIALFAPDGCLIARSDSNGEDLDAFAGAGLYDSVLTKPPVVHQINYCNEQLLWDGKFCTELMSGIARLGRDVEAACGGAPQDIEGVFANGKFTIVQARPQVL